MSDIVTLNVGGHIYTTTRATLTRYSDSMLGCMFSDRLPSALDKYGNYFIDRDGLLFRHVLNFVRTSRLSLPTDFKEYDLLAEEAGFYQIPDLIEAVSDKSTSQDIIIEERILTQSIEDVEEFPDLTIRGNFHGLLMLINSERALCNETGTYSFSDLLSESESTYIERGFSMRPLRILQYRIVEHGGYSRHVMENHLEGVKDYIFKQLWNLGYRLNTTSDGVSTEYDIDPRVKDIVRVESATTLIFKPL